MFHALLSMTDLIADMVSDGWNIRIFLFCALLGTLAGSFTMSLPLAWLVTLVLFVIAINALPKILKG